MKKSLSLLIALFTVVFLFHSCKKAETEKSLADQFAGTYLVYDTLITTPIFLLAGVFTRLPQNVVYLGGLDTHR